MGFDFDVPRESEVPATPEEVWQAIADGPGIDSWFMGHNDVQPGGGGTVTTAFGQYTAEHTITHWEPGRRLAYRTNPGDDGRYVGYEFLIEGRDGGSTVVRVVTSGFLPGDDWEGEYEAMTLGGDLFFATLVTHLTHFAGQTARPVTAFGPSVRDWDDAWARLRRAIGVTAPIHPGSPVRCTLDGIGPIDGVVYASNAHTLGVHTDDALYRFLRGFGGPMVASHHLFADDADPDRAEAAWQGWLDLLFGPDQRE